MRRTYWILYICVCVCVCVCVRAHMCVLYGKYYGLSVCGPYNLYIVVLISSVWIFGGGAIRR